MPRWADENVLIGFDTADDAGVYKLTAELALVQTVDFFTPIVDDPYTFGAIAAANALSDVYAMGGRPISALSILAYPGQGRSGRPGSRSSRAAPRRCARPAARFWAGTASPTRRSSSATRSPAPSIPARVKANAGARAGDALVFTKRLGTGVISTALKRGMAAPEHVEASIASMLTLNRARLRSRCCASTCTAARM